MLDTRTGIEVTDHAIVRWLERVRGIDMDAVRAEIAAHCRTAVEFGAASVLVHNVKFRLNQNIVCTIVRTSTHRPGPVKEPRRSRASDKRAWRREVQI